MDLLTEALAEIFSSTKVKKLCHLTPNQGNVRSKLFSIAHILQEEFTEQGGWDLTIEIDQQYIAILKDVEIEEFIPR